MSLISRSLHRVVVRSAALVRCVSSVQADSMKSASAFSRYTDVNTRKRERPADEPSEDAAAPGGRRKRAAPREARPDAPSDMRSLNSRRAGRGEQGADVTSLSADPYGWDVSERDVREAPLWMVYEAEREEVALRSSSTSTTSKLRDNATEIKPPMRDDLGRAYATGRRKTATARVWAAAGDGNFIVNGVPLASYFPRMSDRVSAMEPLIATRTCGAFDVWLTVRGGGLSGQAGAIRHGLANALTRYDPYLKPLLRSLKLIHRDPRMVERKKPGQMKARRKFQWIKR